jgi:GNAT superfamily N-acetyltransferase
MAEFFRQVWTPEATAQSVTAARSRSASTNQIEPGVPAPTWLAVQDSRVIGYVTTIPVRLWNGQRDWPAHWIKGLMVLPEFRNGPIGFGLLQAATTALPRTGGFAAATPAIRLFEALGYADLGAIPNRVKLLRPGKVLRRMASKEQDIPGTVSARKVIRLLHATRTAGVAGWMAGQALSIAATVRRPALQGLRIETLTPATAAGEIDRLWSITRVGFASAPVRDGAALLLRYDGSSSRRYDWVGARRNGALVGLAILKRPGQVEDPRFPGIRFATLSDLLCRPDDGQAFAGLLVAIEPVARAAGADAILASGSSPDLVQRLARQSYVSVAGNVHFLFRDSDLDTTRFGSTMNEWWLTRGDGSADEAF